MVFSFAFPMGENFKKPKKWLSKLKRTLWHDPLGEKTLNIDKEIWEGYVQNRAKILQKWAWIARFPGGEMCLSVRLCRTMCFKPNYGIFGFRGQVWVGSLGWFGFEWIGPRIFLCPPLRSVDEGNPRGRQLIYTIYTYYLNILILIVQLLFAILILYL